MLSDLDAYCNPLQPCGLRVRAQGLTVGVQEGYKLQVKTNRMYVPITIII